MNSVSSRSFIFAVLAVVGIAPQAFINLNNVFALTNNFSIQFRVVGTRIYSES